jgi:hypothetical protein
MTDDRPSKASKNINYAAEFERRFGPFPPPPPPSEERLQRALRADFATTLHPDDDGALPKAFCKLKLDPDDPADWRRLVEQLAAQRFRTRPKEAKRAAKIDRAVKWMIEEFVIREAARQSAKENGFVARELTQAEVARLLHSTRHKMRSPHYIENILSGVRHLYDTNEHLRDRLKRAGIILVAEQPRAPRKRKTRSIV